MRKIYTRTGDAGKTSLFGGKRVSKTDPRIEAYGNIDELNAAIGLVRSFGIVKKEDHLLKAIQNDLFDLGMSLMAGEINPEVQEKVRMLDANRTKFLEKQIDFYDAKNPVLKNFILPGGTKTASLLQVARAVCRRAERSLVRLSHLKSNLLTYINRLGDLLFVLARYENFRERKKETIWRGRV